MIATIVIIGIALYWLLRETDYMRIRLPVATADTAHSTATTAVSQYEHLNCPQVKFKPSVFIPLDMPATTGNINIICVRE